MTKEFFRGQRFQDKSLNLINYCNRVIRAYQAEGLQLTLRQLYYQLVSANKIPNTEKSYKNLGKLVSNGRLAGLMDWAAIEDRVRRPVIWAESDSIEAKLKAAALTFRLPRLEGQPTYVELWCFPGETPVITDSGTSVIQDVNIGDSVFTREGCFNKVTNRFSRRYEGDLVRLKAVGLPEFSVTPNHRVLSKIWDDSCPGYRGKERKFLYTNYVPSGNLKKFDELLVPRLKNIHLQEPFSVVGGPRSIPITIPVNEETCRVIGLYLAEGSIRQDGRTTQFTFGHTEDDFALSIQNWAVKLGLTTNRVTGVGTIVVYVHGKSLAVWFKDNFGNGSYKKHLPKWAMVLPYELQLEMLKFYYLGDGSKPDKTHPGFVFNTRSESLAAQVQLLLIRLGYGAARRSKLDHGSPMNNVDVAGLFGRKLANVWGLPFPSLGDRTFNHIKIDNHFAYFSIRKVSEVAFSGEVFNIEVETSNTYCTPCVVHNCEKDALAGVLEPLASEFHVVLMVNRGYSSVSAMYEAAKRFNRRVDRYESNAALVLYLGDMDPSGEDMVRDIDDRLNMFSGTHGGVDIEVVKLALTMEQVKEHKLPPNPTKLTDSRAKGFIKKWGRESWEVDALEPKVLQAMIREVLKVRLDTGIMDVIRKREDKARGRLNGLLGQLE